ncbi:hypothetical protein TNCV_2215721 [Trichonephila clavipes]|nr:hypothetical protein TNCV_2215721 [Trichonephila clavipes]
MTTRNRLNDEFKWRGFGWQKAGQSQAEVTHWLVFSTVFLRFQQQFEISDTITRKTGQGCPRGTTLMEES